ncbi:hypothetical protein [Burkholderia lata]|uniref:hypothetical protein n=1 Tax=Burkholderia lata (strain ATCC 17760 / DSM 23089 / LMG 22485 / NCIMB 9086 / R18194 / 383) TaxID=482957 RepID=UPI00145308BB|nr:hypothetical protein [Burkholderia lata]VWM20542.1 hypothetical protein BLA6992_07448 [Burkholderia lata]
METKDYEEKSNSEENGDALLYAEDGQTDHAQRCVLRAGDRCNGNPATPDADESQSTTNAAE